MKFLLCVLLQGIFASSIVALDVQAIEDRPGFKVFSLITLRSLYSVPSYKKDELFSELTLTLKKYSINRHDEYGCTPLHHAVYNADLQLVSYLLAQPNIEIDNGNKNLGISPLMATVYALETNRFIRNGKDAEAFTANACVAAKLLIDHGADVYKQDRFGRTIFDLAKNYKLPDYAHYLSTFKADCAVCFEILDENDVCRLSCAHIFHKTCVENWKNALHFNNNCPLCRNMINS